MREIIQDYKPHSAGDREVIDWDRLVDGRVVTYRNVPMMYLREVTREDFIAEHPDKEVSPFATRYWEVSVD